MKIVLTGGGSGGHYYPLIAVAESLRTIKQEDVSKQGELLELFYIGDKNYSPDDLIRLGIHYIKIPTGKIRIYPSIKNITDIFKFFYSVPFCLYKLFSIYPDVVFSKGGPASIPVMLVARLLRIPIVIHESDTVPGRTTRWASLFAARVATSYPSAADIFRDMFIKKGNQNRIERIQCTGQPLRSSVLKRNQNNKTIALESQYKTIFVIGGSSGALTLNTTIVSSLSSLLQEYQIIHQTGEQHLVSVLESTKIFIDDSPYKNRYHPIGFMTSEEISQTLSQCDIVITRAGSILFEIASHGVPAIVIPIPESHGDHQRKNAYTYAQSGAGIVIEQENLTPSILTNSINTLLEDENRYETMKQAGYAYSKPHARDVIAQELLRIAHSH
jgi:UDP-N-acetylglucosamine--N-acetylmuramyl-(pentapeptide) pyrophosphoryl-undecaprenol N-acetylglucosamine transferase